MGQRLFSVWAELSELAGAESIKLQDSFTLTPRAMEKGYLYQVVLDEAEYMKDSGSSGFYYPIVVGTSEAVDYTLLRKDFIEELTTGVPTRLHFDSTVTVDPVLYMSSISEDFTQPPVDYQERLTVSVTGSLTYNRKENGRDRLFSDKNFVSISGRDLYDKEFSEHLAIIDDGVYVTRNAFAEITAIDHNGFDGSVAVAIGMPFGDTDLLSVYDEYRVAVAEDIEGPLYYRLTTGGVVQAFTRILKQGWQYRRGTVETDNEQLISEITLLNQSDENIDVVAIIMDPASTTLWACDANAKIWVYEPGLPVFSPPDTTVITDKVYVMSQPMTHRAKLNETLQCFTYFLDPSVPVNFIKVKVVDPDGGVLWLQTDGTLGVTEVPLPGPERPVGKQVWKNGETWRDKDFYLVLDIPGIYYIYTIADTSQGVSVDYTGVSAEVWRPVAHYDLELSDVDRMYFTHDNKLAIGMGTLVNHYDLVRDYYVANVNEQTLWLAEEYEAVTVTND
jgi:hypothetical protein